MKNKQQHRILKKFGKVMFLLLFVFSQAWCFSRNEKVKRYLYVGKAPNNREGFRQLKRLLEVQDFDNGHNLVKVIAEPVCAMNIREIFAKKNTRKLYISHYGTPRGGKSGWIMGSNDRKYLYPKTGEIMNTKLQQSHLISSDGRYTNGQFALEIDFKNSQVSTCGDQFDKGGVWT